MTTTPSTYHSAATGTTLVPTPRRFLRCLACGTVKKERSYAICAVCFSTNGVLPRAWFSCFVRHAERETAEYSYRSHPQFEKARRIYARRRQRAEALAAIDAMLPPFRRRETDPRNRHAEEEYDGLGAYDLNDLIDWQMYDVELPQPEGSVHRELSDAEIARWDARVEAWARAQGVSLAEQPAPEIQPWGYAMEIDGVLVWTDDD